MAKKPDKNWRKVGTVEEAMEGALSQMQAAKKIGKQRAEFVAVPAPAKPTRVKGQAPELVLRGEAREEPKKLGAPTTFTQEMADRICRHISNGGALYRFCKEAEGAPHKSTVFDWLERHPNFADQYARARREQQDHFVEEIVEIAKDTTIDVDRARLQIDAQKWIAGKLAPHKYGDRTRTEITGADGGPVRVQTNQIDVSDLSLEELEAFEKAARKTLERKA